MKLTILFVVFVSAILVWWLRSVKPKREDLIPALRRANSSEAQLSCCILQVGQTLAAGLGWASLVARPYAGS